MAPTRRSTENLAAEVKFLLNRPDVDDLLDFPDAYYRALSKAHRHCRGLVIRHAPGLMVVETTVTSSDGGESYDLGDHWHFLELWAPPGPPRGEPIPPILPETPGFGWYQQGTEAHFTMARDYSPLYVRWIPVTVPDMDEATGHTLPAYCEDWLCLRAAYELASVPGVGADANEFRVRANMEFHGDRQNPGDAGVLSHLVAADEWSGHRTTAFVGDKPWYKGIGGG